MHKRNQYWYVTIAVFGIFAISGFTSRVQAAYPSVELIKNGDFEAVSPVGSGWRQFLTNIHIGTKMAFDVDGTSWHSGDQGVRLGVDYGDISKWELSGGHTTGPYGIQGLKQTVKVPEDATSATLSYWYMRSDKVGTGRNTVESIIEGGGGGTPYSFCGDVSFPATNRWIKKECTFDVTPWSGRGVNVAFYLLAFNGTYESYVNIDDVSLLVKVTDRTAPTTTASYSAAPIRGRYFTSAPTITLSAIDDEGGSGVAGISYAWDGGEYGTYTAPFTVPAGEHVLKYFATDAAGNQEAVHEETVIVDDSLPSVSVSLSGFKRSGDSLTVTVSGTINDALTDVASLTVDATPVTYDADGSFSTTVTLSTGTHAVTVVLTDKNGITATATRSVIYRKSLLWGEIASHPSITKIDRGMFQKPTRKTAKQRLVIRGKNFNSKAVVLVGSRRLRPHSVSDGKSITVLVPTGAMRVGRYSLSVVNNDGQTYVLKNAVRIVK